MALASAFCEYRRSLLRCPKVSRADETVSPVYALYVSLLKKRIGSESRVSMPLFFGFVGILSIALMWPVGLVLHLTGLERVELPHGRAMWSGVAANMAITVVSDFAYLLSMLKTAPLVATVGLSLTIPLAMAIDLVRGTHSGGMTANIGSLAVLLSFVAIGWDDSQAVETLSHGDGNGGHPSDQRTEAVHDVVPERPVST